MKIGIFDSGIGGLSILREVASLMPDVELFYYADRNNAPYGNKSKSEVIDLCHKIVDIFIENGIRNILVACNSATAMAINELRSSYPDISFFGVEPYINIINTREDLKSKKGAVLTTVLTAESKRFISLRERFDKNSSLDYFTSKNLARLIDESFDSKTLNEAVIINEIATSFNDDISIYDFVILGCTHYPFVSELFEREFDLQAVSPCYNVARHLASQCDDRDIGEAFDHFLYFNDEQWQKVKKINLEGFPFF